MNVTPLHTLPDSPPMPTQLGGLIAHGALTLFEGDTEHVPTLGLALATVLTIGGNFGSLTATPGNVLYAAPHGDAYVSRQAHRISRGLGLAHPPLGLDYLSLAYTREEATAGHTLARLSSAPVGMLVIDSLPAEALSRFLPHLHRGKITTLALSHDSEELSREWIVASRIRVSVDQETRRVELRQTWNIDGPLLPLLVLEAQQDSRATRFVQVVPTERPQLRLTTPGSA